MLKKNKLKKLELFIENEKKEFEISCKECLLCGKVYLTMCPNHLKLIIALRDNWNLRKENIELIG